MANTRKNWFAFGIMTHPIIAAAMIENSMKIICICGSHIHTYAHLHMFSRMKTVCLVSLYAKCVSLSFCNTHRGYLNYQFHILIWWAILYAVYYGVFACGKRNMRSYHLVRASIPWWPQARSHTHTYTHIVVLYAFYAFPFQQPTIIKVHMIKVTSLWTRSFSIQYWP